MTIAEAVKKLLIDSPFYGNVLLGMTKMEDKRIPSLCISLCNGAVILKYNPRFWESMSDEQQYEVLKHELMHICLFHPFQADDFTDIDTRNIAADAEVNQYLNIQNLPCGCVNILKWYPNWPEKAGMREYYRRLIQDNQSQVPLPMPNSAQKALEEELKAEGEQAVQGHGQHEDEGEAQEEGEEGGTIESSDTEYSSGNSQQPDYSDSNPNTGFEKIVNHDSWSEISDSSESMKELLRNHIETLVLEASDRTKSQGGAIPSEMSEIIGKIKAKNIPVFDWKGYLRRIIGNAEERFIKFTYRRPSKRFPDSRGVEQKRKLKVLIALDCSGSVSAKEVHEFYATMCQAQKANIEMDCIEFDTEILREYPFKKWDGTITGRGGTEFLPVYEYANKHSRKYQLLIMLTDGYCSLPTIKCEIPILWVISSSGAKKQYPGKAIYIPQPKNGSDNT